MGRRTRATLAVVRAGIAKAIAYRGQLAIWAVESLFPLVMMAVWLSVVDESGTAAGWDRSDFVSYYAAAAVVFPLTASVLVWDWDEAIRTGTLSFLLLRPLSPLVHHVALDVGQRIVSACLLVPVLVAAALVFDDVQMTLVPWRIVVAVVAMCLGFAVATATAAVIAMLAFWSTQSGTLYGVWWGIGAFLSGWVAPVAVLPDRVRAVAEVLPFQMALGVPVEVLIGRTGGAELAWAFVVALIWFAGLAIVQRVLWRAGVHRYQAVGG